MTTRAAGLVTGGLFRYRVWTNADVRDDNPWFLFPATGVSLTRAGGSPTLRNAGGRHTARRQNRAFSV